MQDAKDLTRQLVPVVQTLPTLADLKVMATLADNFKGLAGSLFPKDIDTPAKALAVMEAGRELGAPPMVAFRHMFIVNGRVQPDGELIEAVIRCRDPTADFEIERSPERCKITLRRQGKHPVTLEYRIDQVPDSVKTYWDKDSRQRKPRVTWADFTEDMLFWWTMKRVGRMGAADLINAMSGVDVAEAEDMLDAIEGEAHEVTEPATATELEAEQAARDYPEQPDSAGEANDRVHEGANGAEPGGGVRAGPESAPSSEGPVAEASGGENPPAPMPEASPQELLDALHEAGCLTTDGKTDWVKVRAILKGHDVEIMRGLREIPPEERARVARELREPPEDGQ